MSLSKERNGMICAFIDGCARKRCPEVTAAKASSGQAVEKSKRGENSRTRSANNSIERAPSAAAFAADERECANFLRRRASKALARIGSRADHGRATRDV